MTAQVCQQTNAGPCGSILGLAGSAESMTGCARALQRANARGDPLPRYPLNAIAVDSTVPSQSTREWLSRLSDMGYEGKSLKRRPPKGNATNGTNAPEHSAWADALRSSGGQVADGKSRDMKRFTQNFV